MASLDERLAKIKSPNLQSQQQTAVVLNAVEETLQAQNAELTPTGYFAALLALLRIPTATGGDKALTTPVVYLLDLVAPYTPQPLLRSEFTQILSRLAPALALEGAEAPLVKAVIGCLETLLLAQDSAAWKLPQTQIGPRRALAGLLALAMDPRPKIRKRALDAITRILQNPPPSPAIDHPAADMCAETALSGLIGFAAPKKETKQQKNADNTAYDPMQLHALKLVKTVALAAGGWPSKKIESLCDVLLGISKTTNEFMMMSSFEIFEVMFEGMAEDVASVKLPRLLEIITQLKPSKDDGQLLPPWIAVLSRAHEVAALVDPIDTFQKLPDLFVLVSDYMMSSSHNIRTSAAECLVSFMVNCVPDNVLVEPSVYDEKVFTRLGETASGLLGVKYQAAWMETFQVLGAMFEAFRWRADPSLIEALKTLGALRSHESFNGKKEADAVLAKAVTAIGPESILNVLPLNLAQSKPGQPGRAWLLPILRNAVRNTSLVHFTIEMVPLASLLYQKVLAHGSAEKTMDIKIYETLVQQIWSLLPGYCTASTDLMTSFNQEFAEMLAEILYNQDGLRIHVCRGLQNLVETTQALLELDDDDVVLFKVPKAQARMHLNHLATFASNLLAVLFNIYMETLLHHRGYILQCINAYLSIVDAKELMSTYERINQALSDALTEQPQPENPKDGTQIAGKKMPPMSHTLMDLVITISIYLPRESYGILFTTASTVINRQDDAQLQKKAYKLIPRLAESETGKAALRDQQEALQSLLLNSTEHVSTPAKRDRLAAIAALLPYVPDDGLHFIPSVLSEVVISCKEANERTRTNAFELLVSMGQKMQAAKGKTIENRKIAHMPPDAPNATASLEEFFTMVSAGLAGSTPHMVSASITALARILYEFREAISAETLTDLVQTMDLFLTSNNREIVQSVLGFVKVCVLSLPLTLMQPRLQTLIPNLMVWSHEHKAHFKVKVKHILERMIKRFGVEIVNQYCPEDDRKLIANIRKSKDRLKRQKQEAKAAGAEGEIKDKRKGRFESEFDEAVYGSNDESNGSDTSDDEVTGRKARSGRKAGNTFIVEDEDEPLDLLDRKALASISSTKPSKQKKAVRSKAKVDLDGKLLLGESSDEDDTMIQDAPAGRAGDQDISGVGGGGVDAYVHALKGRDAVKRGRGGRLKFSNKRAKGDGADVDDDADLDEGPGADIFAAVKAKVDSLSRKGGAAGAGAGKNGPTRRLSGRGGISNGRRGLGEAKRRQESVRGGGKVAKRGAAGGRGGRRR